MGTFSSTNIMDLVLNERTHRIKIKYSMHQYSIRLHNLGNWLIIPNCGEIRNKSLTPGHVQNACLI